MSNKGKDEKKRKGRREGKEGDSRLERKKEENESQVQFGLFYRSGGVLKQIVQVKEQTHYVSTI